jgi:hypothetical protein
VEERVSMILSLRAYYKFPLYRTPEDYQRGVGGASPRFDSRRPPKFWFDPAARNPQAPRKISYDVIAYDGRTPVLLDGQRPFVEPMLLSREEAGTVNIPPDVTNFPGADAPEVPMPLRALEPWAKLEMGGAGAHGGGIGVLHVWDTRTPEPILLVGVMEAKLDRILTLVESIEARLIEARLAARL